MSAARSGCFLLTSLIVSILFAPAAALAQAPPVVEYRVLATSKTSTMEKELNDAAEAGFRFVAIMGGETGAGGKEAVVVMSRVVSRPSRVAYKLLATRKTSTMEKEIQDAADEGFHYRDQTVFESLFGGKEVVCILERDLDMPMTSYEYTLLATAKTSTMQKELQEAGTRGYEALGLTVGQTALGGNELVVITRRKRQ